MKHDAIPEQAAARALAQLLSNHPEFAALVWVVGETPGTLTGHQIADHGNGEIINLCADAMGGTIVRSILNRGDDRQGVAELGTDYAGVSVQVGASYPLPAAQGMTHAEQHRLLTGRRIGSLVCIPGGDR